ncbi:MAG: endonuclease III domain-containing protein [Syntrophales bacterium]|nr:endonuclease III domain-containing protein [Syntrophales bacterium]
MSAPVFSPSQWITAAYAQMEARFGDLHWWPGETPEEVIVGAILTQNTAWRNVEKSIAALKAAGCLSAAALAVIPRDRLAALIRSSGFFNVKAERLQHFMRWFMATYGGDTGRMFAVETALLREQLLCLRGIGEETADSILLYGGGKPVFVVDAYTRRILARHGLIAERASYGHVQSLFTAHLPLSAPLFNQYHALLVETGKRFCRKRPLCGDCPLQDLGPVRV